MAEYNFTQRSLTLDGVFRVSAGNQSIVAFDTEGDFDGNRSFQNGFIRCYTSLDEGKTFAEVKIADLSEHGNSSVVYFGFSGGYFFLIINTRNSGEVGYDENELYRSQNGIEWEKSVVNEAPEYRLQQLIMVGGVLVTQFRGNSQSLEMWASFNYGETFERVDINLGNFLDYAGPFVGDTDSPGWSVAGGAITLNKSTGLIGKNNELSSWVGRGGFYNRSLDLIVTSNLYVFKDGEFGEQLIGDGRLSGLIQSGESDCALLVASDWDGNYGIIRSNGKIVEGVAGVTVIHHQEEYEGEVYEYYELVFDGYGIEPDPSFGPITSEDVSQIESICLGGDRHLICIVDQYANGVGSMRFVLAEPKGAVIEPFIPFWTNKVGSYEQAT